MSAVVPTARGALLALLLQDEKHTLTSLRMRLSVSRAQLSRDLRTLRSAAAEAGWGLCEERVPNGKSGPGDKIVWMTRGPTGPMDDPR